MPQNTTLMLQPHLGFIGLENVCVWQYSQNTLVRSTKPPLELNRHPVQILHPQCSLRAGAHSCGLKEQTATLLHAHGELLCYSNHIQYLQKIHLKAKMDHETTFQLSVSEIPPAV